MMPVPGAPQPSRRSFLIGAAAVTTTALSAHPFATLAQPTFPSADPAWQRTWDAALAVLTGNIRTLPGYDKPVLIEGSSYLGVWQECAPHEALVYASLMKHIPQGLSPATPLQIARNNHMAFFQMQRPDGQLPANVKASGIGFGQIQMVVPIAATAWELADKTGDEELLAAAYQACGLWDAWLRKYRDTRKTGLVEGFCTYDTGHDNSPRWKGIPNACPDGDARNCPPLNILPRLCPDLSATVYGARIALAAMAKALGKPSESARWHSDAEIIRQLILNKLYSPEDAAFYDLDAQNKFVRVRSDVLSRVLGEHVLDLSQKRDRKMFQAIWTRQLHNPKAFWPAFPFPSIALDDPTFVRPIPRNSWGGASQALTALRAPRWMPHYGKQAELTQLMQSWSQAIMRHGEFRQQLDPLTGDFTQPDPGGYSPAALVFLSFAQALAKAA
jgi:hypothetical protein